MSEPIIVHPSDVEDVEWPGGGKGRRMISPLVPGSKKLLLGIIYVEPGKSAHRWHTHTYDRADTFEIIYPEDFEEAYFIVKGKGTVYWKIGDEVKQVEVEEGDAIYFPVGVVEHQLVNTGSDIMIVIYAGTPPVKVKKLG